MRALVISDLEAVVRHRLEMFREMRRPEADLAVMAAGFRLWLAPKLVDESYFGWVIEENDGVIAGLGMFVMDWPPHPSHPADSRRAYILNVFVEPEHRGKGLATALMRRAQDEARTRGITFLVLHASPQGRPVYEKLGWKPTTEMSLAV